MSKKIWLIQKLKKFIVNWQLRCTAALEILGTISWPIL